MNCIITGGITLLHKYNDALRRQTISIDPPVLSIQTEHSNWALVTELALFSVVSAAGAFCIPETTIREALLMSFHRWHRRRDRPFKRPVQSRCQARTVSLSAHVLSPSDLLNATPANVAIKTREMPLKIDWEHAAWTEPWLFVYNQVRTKTLTSVVVFVSLSLCVSSHRLATGSCLCFQIAVKYVRVLKPNFKHDTTCFYLSFEYHTPFT